MFLCRTYGARHFYLFFLLRNQPELVPDARAAIASLAPSHVFVTRTIHDLRRGVDRLSICDSLVDLESAIITRWVIAGNYAAVSTDTVVVG